MTAKLIYRAERFPGLDRLGFRERWRRHAALGMSQPRWANIRRYAHCDPIHDSAPCDGVALLWYRSEEARLRHIAEPSARAIMRADEAETFARPVREFSAIFEETPTSVNRNGAFKLFVFVWRPPAMTRAAFAESWRDEHAPQRERLLAAHRGFRGLTLNLARSDNDLAGFGLDCDGIEESDWDAPQDVERPPPSHGGRVEALWTRHILLWDAETQA